MTGNNSVDMNQLQWDDHQEIQNSSRSCKRGGSSIRLWSPGQGATRQYGDDPPSRVKIPISPAMPLVEDHEYVRDESEQCRCGQQPNALVITLAQATQEC